MGHRKNDASTSQRPQGDESVDLIDYAGSGERRRAWTDDQEPEALSSAQVARLLDEAARWLVLVPVGPLYRELELGLDRYRRAARDWDTRTPMQRKLLVDAIHFLRGAIAQSVADRD